MVHIVTGSRDMTETNKALVKQNLFKMLYSCALHSYVRTALQWLSTIMDKFTLVVLFHMC